MWGLWGHEFIYANALISREAQDVLHLTVPWWRWGLGVGMESQHTISTWNQADGRSIPPWCLVCSQCPAYCCILTLPQLTSLWALDFLTLVLINTFTLWKRWPFTSALNRFSFIYSVGRLKRKPFNFLGISMRYSPNIGSSMYVRLVSFWTIVLRLVADLSRGGKLCWSMDTILRSVILLRRYAFRSNVRK